MAPRPNKDVLADYRKKIEHSRKWRKEEKYDKLWRRMIDLYKGKHFSDMSVEDRMLINVSFSTINVIGPSVAVNHPKITVGARKSEDGDKAIITEAIVNYWWRHFDCQKQLRRAVDDYLIIGHAWLKVGYRFVEEEKLKKITPFSVQDFSYAHDSSLELSPSCLELLGRKYDALEEMSGTLYPDSYSNCRLKGNFIVATRTEKPS